MGKHTHPEISMSKFGWLQLSSFATIIVLAKKGDDTCAGFGCASFPTGGHEPSERDFPEMSLLQASLNLAPHRRGGQCYGRDTECWKVNTEEGCRKLRSH